MRAISQIFDLIPKKCFLHIALTVSLTPTPTFSLRPSQIIIFLPFSAVKQDVQNLRINFYSKNFNHVWCVF